MLISASTVQPRGVCMRRSKSSLVMMYAKRKSDIYISQTIPWHKLGEYFVWEITVRTYFGFIVVRPAVTFLVVIGERKRRII